MEKIKKVLFLSFSFYDFKNKEKTEHLKEKFEGLNQKIQTFVLGRGRPFFKKEWGTRFYLLPNKMLFYSYGFKAAFLLCLFKKIDIVIAQSPLFEGFLGSRLKRIFKIELIIEAHGDWDAVGDRPGQGNVKTLLGAVAIHRSEQNFTGAERNHFLGIFDGIDTGRIASTMGEDLPAIRPTRALDPLGIDRNHNALLAELFGGFLDELAP